MNELPDRTRRSAAHNVSDGLTRMHLASLQTELTAAKARIVKLRTERDRVVGLVIAAEAEAARLREALEPFAKLADYFDGATTPMPDSLALNHGVTLGDCRRARQALHPIHKETT